MSTRPSGSTAVMARRKEPPDSLDYFPTPAWATRALIEHVICHDTADRALISAQSCWEPACGEGCMARPLGEYFRSMTASDIYPYGFGQVYDFTSGLQSMAFQDAPVENPDWIITNPPFKTAQMFIDVASKLAWTGFAMLVRTQFVEGIGRYQELFKGNPPSIIAQFTERVPMFKGQIDPNGSTATAYCWLVWIDGEPGTRFMWIPPCRKLLERPGDYPSGQDAPLLAQVTGKES